MINILIFSNKKIITRFITTSKIRIIFVIMVQKVALPYLGQEKFLICFDLVNLIVLDSN